MSAPLSPSGTIVGGVTLMGRLEGVYQDLRAIQGGVLFYLGINTLLLTLIGLYRISQKLVTPLYTLLERAESFEGDDPSFFPSEKPYDEFNRLSKALNQMIGRMTANKRELRLTVDSLEKANNHLKKARQDMINAEKLASVGRLAAGIAHEIGNPIAIIMGYLELLRSPIPSGPERADFLQRAQDELNRVNLIIRQLLDLSRPAKANPQILSVHDLLRETMEVFRCQPLTSALSIHFHPDADDDRVRADPSQLRQVFLNLAINAADALAGREDGVLTIRTENHAPVEERPLLDSLDITGHAARYLRVHFTDNGSGIAPEHIHAVFDPFFTTKAPGKGTGLGLSVSYMIVEAAGGSMRVRPNEDRGITMTITLPLVESHE